MRSSICHLVLLDTEEMGRRWHLFSIWARVRPTGNPSYNEYGNIKEFSPYMCVCSTDTLVDSVWPLPPQKLQCWHLPTPIHPHTHTVAQYFSLLCILFLGLPTKGQRALKYVFREGVKKKNGKKAVRLTAWVDPPPPPPKRSGKCEKYSTSCHIWGYFAIL